MIKKHLFNEQELIYFYFVLFLFFKHTWHNLDKVWETNILITTECFLLSTKYNSIKLEQRV